ncbi:NAD(P)-binding oxidoreductase [Kitasatospora sp. CM 4170]|uniref:NAD(P)-binding oxidoreductase n=1 Tax=Kitasatospora aburaviensis TaxID=67265 RepID=A0ABW1F4Q5_9ACTN|nr:NAD(P)-binding oxidoreductase [Kitasatospora sp. CM 4170]WNM45851.1 NAD(P)-binding oxidoreductase [Kitasatospora sp. CM 4170]
MRTVIAGGHGQIALKLERLLAERGDRPAGIIRRPEQAADLADAGAEPLLLDLESATAPELAGLLEGADAVVFAAGAGPGSGAARKNTVDRDAAVLLADAAELAGVRRYLIISSMGADAGAEHAADPVFETYLRAKGAADDAVRARTTLDWTVLRPGRLTDGPGTGLVRLAPSVARGAVDRADVAAVLAALLHEPGTAGQTLELVAGNATVEEAVAAAAGHNG